MKTEQFLKHHGIVGNPFSEEDAQTDTVFKRGCLTTIHHPAWDKFFGSPADPSTALVFGEKGSGKTALRLQVTSELESYNNGHPDARVFVISYDDFNPFLDHFRDALRARDAGEALGRWRLQDHMDAILALGVTQLIDALTAEKADLTALTLDQRRDLLRPALPRRRAPLARRPLPPALRGDADGRYERVRTCQPVLPTLGSSGTGVPVDLVDEQQLLEGHHRTGLSLDQLGLDHKFL